MGKGYITECLKCGYEDYFHLGIGMQFHLEEKRILAKIQNGDYGKKAKENLSILEKYTPEERFNNWYMNFKNELFYCRKCKSVVVRPYFVLGDFSPKYDCDLCKKHLTKVSPLKVKKHRCPKCGMIGKFDKDRFMLWD